MGPASESNGLDGHRKPVAPSDRPGSGSGRRAFSGPGEDVDRTRSRQGLERLREVSSAGDELPIAIAVDQPPQTTRAKLRGDFIRKAKEKKRDYTVDWVHLKLDDQAQRTVLCKDPFRFEDERVDKLIASL